MTTHLVCRGATRRAIHPLLRRWRFAIAISLLILPGIRLRGAQTVQTDVCVYGGVPGGIAAAIEATRLGKTVALVVANNHLGGMTSSGLSGVTDIGDNGDAYIQGIAREFYNAVAAHYGIPGPAYSFEPHVAEQVFDQMVQTAGVQVYFNQQLATAQMNGSHISQITMLNGNVFQAKVFIDASYEGDLLKQAGVTYTIGREANSQYGETLNGIQPIPSLNQLPTGIDPYIIAGNPASGLLPGVNPNSGGPVGSADTKIPGYCYRLCLTNVPSNRIMVTQPPGYNPANYELFFRAIAAGQNTDFFSGWSEPNGKIDSNNYSGMSLDFIGMDYAYPEASWATRAEIELAHENWERGFIWALQNDPRVPASIRSTWGQWGLCADEFPDTNHWPPQLYVRESRRMISDYVMTQANVFGAAVPSDPIGEASYLVDCHNVQRVVSNGMVQDEGNIQQNVSAPYQVSYRSIVPSAGQCTNLLVPWCLSASHIAYCSIRMEPVAMILGQSAGTAACISIDDATSVQTISYPKLQAQLLAEGQALGSVTGTTSGIILDNASPSGVLITGTWTVSTGVSGYYGPDYLHDGDTGQGTKSVSFTPTIVLPGSYTVSMWWTAAANRATNVPVDIITATGTTTVTVNEQQTGSQWVTLGTYPFTTGTAGSVVVRDTGANGYVVANSMRFTYTPNQPVISVWATNALAAAVSPETGALVPGAFSVGCSGTLANPLTVNLSIGGSAVSGVDYSSLPASVTIPAGASSVTIPVTPLIDLSATGNTTVSVSAVANPNYILNTLNSANVTLQLPQATPELVGSPSVTGTVGLPFSYQVAATNTPRGFNATGLPSGLAINPATGLISGTATAPGAANVVVSATNASGASYGSLNITMLSSFSSWQQQSFSASDLARPAVSSDTADPAGDGISNLMKYALNLSPQVNGLAGLPVQSTTTIYGNTYLTLTFSYSALASDLSYIVEVSDDLQNWYSGDGYTLTLSVTPNSDGLTNTCTVEDALPIGPTPQFIRLRVVGP